MCGIFAMFLRRPLQPADLAAGRCVLEEIAHRGPDGQGEWVDHKKGVYFGHRRLSIIDISHASDQPIVHDGQPFIFNGELYNFRQLRENLEALGEKFISNGDGEVFLRGLQQWGSGILDRADGMFSLAHWDGCKGMLAVDAFGEKPLFVAQTCDGVFVCSEIKPLAKMLGITPSLTVGGWVAYLNLGFIPQPGTFYPGIEMMPPATCREVVEGRLGPIRRYWEISPPLIEHGKPEPVSEFELDRLVDALSSSLSRRLIADVPLTLFLSAGIDSALIAALCRYELKQDLHCLTVAFRNGTMRDESAAAGKIAAYLGFSHQVLECNTDIDIGVLPDLLGQPTGTVGALPLMQLSALARMAGFKVALTGMGGDETTSGYAKHAYLWKLRNLYAISSSLRRVGSGILRHLHPSFAGMASLLAADNREVYLAIKNYPALFWLRSLPGYGDFVAREFEGFDIPLVAAVPRYEIEKVMPAVHLYISDHASMRHSLELRTPFLDRRFVEVIAGWDARSLVAFGQKSILRRILARYLPRELTDYPKTGFSFPRESLLFGSMPKDLPGLGDVNIEQCWKHRHKGGGWAAIAVRMRTAERFFKCRSL